MSAQSALKAAREYVADAVDAHRHDDGVALLVQIDALLALSAGSETFQDRAGEWGVACFTEEVVCDELERMDRHVEEVYEGLQSRGYPRERLAALERYVWSRPVGETFQEVGRIMMTLALWCRAMGVDMHAAGEAELARVWTKVDQIRAKQAAKPVGSALPIATSRRREILVGLGSVAFNTGVRGFAALGAAVLAYRLLINPRPEILAVPPSMLALWLGAVFLTAVVSVQVER